MDWKISLDRWLTSCPDDGYDSWAEQVINALSDEFYNAHEDWANDGNGECNKWLYELYKQVDAENANFGSPEWAAKEIEARFKREYPKG